MLKEFKEFAMRGNVIDLAVGVVIGTAFGKIVSSFVSDVIMPPIGVLTGGVNFADLAFVLKEATEESASVTLNYGTFLNTLIDFIIIAFAIFIAIKALNKFKKKEEAKAKPAKPSNEEVLLTEIRDVLKNK